MNKSTLVTLGIVGIVVAGLLVYGFKSAETPGKLDALAQCVKDRGAIFYGAFWCPHCQAQKALFDKSEKLLPYVECSTPDGKGQKQNCTDAGVTGYPTWVFADGSRLVGNVSLVDLAAKTSCALPTE